jgi:hypothetical protein
MPLWSSVNSGVQVGDKVRSGPQEMVVAEIAWRTTPGGVRSRFGRLMNPRSLQEAQEKAEAEAREYALRKTAWDRLLEGDD